MAFYKAQLAAGQRLPMSGTAFLTVNKRDQAAMVPIARRLHGLGFKLVATRGTAANLREHGIEVEDMLRVSEGRPNGVDAVKSGQIALIVNTPLGADAFRDGERYGRRRCSTTYRASQRCPGADAAVEAIAALNGGSVEVMSLQELQGVRGIAVAPATAGARRRGSA